jgi:hypothetical protein
MIGVSVALLIVAGVLLLAGIALGIFGIVRTRKDHFDKYGWCVGVGMVLCFGAVGFALLSHYAAIAMSHIK